MSSSPALTLRAIAPDDAETIVTMLRALAHHVKPGFVPLVTPADVRELGPFGAKAFDGVIAHLGDQPVGMVLWSMLFSGYRGTAGAFINDLYVEPQQRGRGIGEKLVEAVIESSKCGYIRLDVSRTNVSAIGFYHRLGFEADEGDYTMVRDRHRG